MTRKYVDDRGAVRNLTIRGGDGSAIAVAERFLKGSLSFSTSQISQLSMTVRENGIAFDVLRSGLFAPSNGSGGNVNDGALDLDDLRMTLASVGADGDGRGVNLTAQARSLGGVRMTANLDASTMSQVDPSEWVRRKAASLGLRTVVKASGQVWAQVGNESGKDSWATATELAKKLGYWCFEAAGTLYFGPPTWLVTQTTRRAYAWKVRPITEPYFEDPLLAMPSVRRVGDADPGVSGTTASFVLRDSENDLLPGMGIDLTGIPGFEGTYIVTDVRFDLAPAARVAVTAERPVDPIPEQKTFVRSEALENISAAAPAGVGTLRTPAPGRYGGTSFTAEQLLNASTIVQVARDKRLIMPVAAILALACAMQESRLRNLAGGDRDSVGLFQQRPSQGWGTVAQCRTPTYAAGRFYDVLVRSVPAYGQATSVTARGNAIQKVQRSGFPRAYDKWMDEAEALVAAIVVSGTTTVSAAAASTPASAGGQVESFVQKCLAQAGKKYVFGAETRLADPSPDAFDCSELVQWAAYQVGVTIADGSQNQRRACRAFRPLTVAQAVQIRGALLFTDHHVAISLGDGRTIEARGRAYGVVVVENAVKRFVDAGAIPGMSGYRV